MRLLKAFASIILALLVFSMYLWQPEVSLAGFVANLTSPVSNNIYQLYLYGETGSSGTVHHGVDFSAPEGTPVKAAASGTVYISTDLIDENGKYYSYGKYIVIEHYDVTRGTYYTLYAHLSSRSVNQGDTVTYGQIIGYSGNTGNSGGPHLHFEIRKGTYSYYSVRNPECWLQRSNYDGYGSVYSMCKTSSGSRIEGMRISGATKPESGYGASYTYARMSNGAEFGDIGDYSINYHIARANPGSVTLTYAKTGYTTKTQNVTIDANISKRINDMIW